MGSTRVMYVITAKFEGQDRWREWHDAEFYDDAWSALDVLRRRHPDAKFRLVERKITDTITDA